MRIRTILPLTTREPLDRYRHATPTLTRRQRFNLQCTLPQLRSTLPSDPKPKANLLKRMTLSTPLKNLLSTNCQIRLQTETTCSK